MTAVATLLTPVKERTEAARAYNVTARIVLVNQDVPRLIQALEAVEELAEKWRYKGEFGWGAWQEGHGPDETGQALDHAASELRAAVTAALGGGE